MIILMMMMMILMMILMILMILMMKRHLYKACLNWLTSVRLIIVLRIITRILVRIILRICPVSRMRIRPVSGIWFRAKNPYSSPTIMPLSFLSIFITFWFSNRLIFTRTEFFREWISNFTSTIWRDFIDKCWNNSILNALTRWFHEKSCQNKVVTIAILQNDEISLLIIFWFSNRLISSSILYLNEFQIPHQRFDEILSMNTEIIQYEKVLLTSK